MIKLMMNFNSLITKICLTTHKLINNPSLENKLKIYFPRLRNARLNNLAQCQIQTMHRDHSKFGAYYKPSKLLARLAWQSIDN